MSKYTFNSNGLIQSMRQLRNLKFHTRIIKNRMRLTKDSIHRIEDFRDRVEVIKHNWSIQNAMERIVSPVSTYNQMVEESKSILDHCDDLLLIASRHNDSDFSQYAENMALVGEQMSKAVLNSSLWKSLRTTE